MQEYLQKHIKNLRSDLCDRLVKEINELQIPSNKIINFVRINLGLAGKSRSHTSIDYWLLRGWNYEESLLHKSNFLKRRPNRSPYSISSYVNRINPDTKKIYTLEEINYQIKSKRPVNKEYWIRKGYSEDDALLEISKFQTTMALKVVHAKDQKTMCKEYWIKKGYSEDDALIEIYKRQNTLSLKSRIEQNGLRKGILLYLHFKNHRGFISELKKSCILRKSILSSYKKCNNDIDEFFKLIPFFNDLYKKEYGHASRESMKIFKKFYFHCKDKNIKIEIGFDGNKEFKIYYNKKKYKRYDFCIIDKNLIIEYDSDYYHIDKSNDEFKDKLAKENGFSIFRLNSKDGIKINHQKMIDIFITYDIMDKDDIQKLNLLKK